MLNPLLIYPLIIDSKPAREDFKKFILSDNKICARIRMFCIAFSRKMGKEKEPYITIAISTPFPRCNIHTYSKMQHDKRNHNLHSKIQVLHEES